MILLVNRYVVIEQYRYWWFVSVFHYSVVILLQLFWLYSILSFFFPVGYKKIQT